MAEFNQQQQQPEYSAQYFWAQNLTQIPQIPVAGGLSSSNDLPTDENSLKFLPFSSEDNQLLLTALHSNNDFMDLTVPLNLNASLGLDVLPDLYPYNPENDPFQTVPITSLFLPQATQGSSAAQSSGSDEIFPPSQSQSNSTSPSQFSSFPFASNNAQSNIPPPVQFVGSSNSQYPQLSKPPPISNSIPQFSFVNPQSGNSSPPSPPSNSSPNFSASSTSPSSSPPSTPHTNNPPNVNVSLQFNPSIANNNNNNNNNVGSTSQEPSPSIVSGASKRSSTSISGNNSTSNSNLTEKQKSRRRASQNQASRNYRQRKKEYVAEMENQLESLVTEIERLKRENNEKSTLVEVLMRDQGSANELERLKVVLIEKTSTIESLLKENAELKVEISRVEELKQHQQKEINTLRYEYTKLRGNSMRSNSESRPKSPVNEGVSSGSCCDENGEVMYPMKSSDCGPCGAQKDDECEDEGVTTTGSLTTVPMDVLRKYDPLGVDMLSVEEDLKGILQQMNRLVIEIKNTPTSSEPTQNPETEKLSALNGQFMQKIFKREALNFCRAKKLMDPSSVTSCPLISESSQKIETEKGTSNLKESGSMTAEPECSYPSDYSIDSGNMREITQNGNKFDIVPMSNSNGVSVKAEPSECEKKVMLHNNPERKTPAWWGEFINEAGVSLDQERNIRLLREGHTFRMQLILHERCKLNTAIKDFYRRKLLVFQEQLWGNKKVELPCMKELTNNLEVLKKNFTAEKNLQQCALKKLQSIITPLQETILYTKAYQNCTNQENFQVLATVWQAIPGTK